MNVFECEVNSYKRVFAGEFLSAEGCFLVDVKRQKYLDFLSGCGSLNYGHNHPVLAEHLIEYIRNSGVTMSMDMLTSAKRHFMDVFQEYILKPRELNYKLQFTGPTGTNAIEAAIKLARKVTKRTNIVSFTNGFHGCTLGTLALTGNSLQRESSQMLLNQVTRAAYDGYFGPAINTVDQLRKLLKGPSSGYDLPAAIIVELIQGEGGLSVATEGWLRDVAALAKEVGAILIVDDVQAGCGRSGKFFSFEGFGVEPDIVVLAKAISGFGLPMALVLLKEELDVWQPGEHNGTFRGNNHAFVTAAAAIETFWSTPEFAEDLQSTADHLTQNLKKIALRNGFSPKGRGLMQGIDFKSGALANHVRKLCYEQKMIVENCGPYSEVLKLLPPLNISRQMLDDGLSRIEEAIATALKADITKEMVVEAKISI